MKMLSDKNFPDPLVGDTVRVGVLQFERGKTDARNILACVMEVIEGTFFRFGTCDRILKHLYSESQFQLCHEKFLCGLYTLAEFVQ